MTRTKLDDKPGALAKQKELAKKLSPEEKKELTRKASILLRESIGMVCSKDIVLGYLLCSVETSVQECGTAQAGFRNGSFFVGVDPYYFCSLKAVQRCALLEHEALHILHLHTMRLDGREWPRWNIACDMAINQQITNLPEGGIFPPKGLEGLSAEEYYDKIDVQEINLFDFFEQAKGATSEEMRGAVKKVLSDIAEATGMTEQEVKQAVAQKVQESGSKTRGTTPGANLLEVSAEKTVFEMGLRALMSIRSDDYRRTLKRPHRRVPDYPWGRRREEQTKVVVAVDSSGSVSQRLLNRFFGEVLKLLAISNDVQVIVADSDIQRVFQLKNERDFNRLSGGGGTDFDPAIRYANQFFRDYDIMIYLTDGECSFPETRCLLPLIWVVTGVRDWPGRPTIFAPELEA